MTETLRTTLGLNADESLVITNIAAASRRLSTAERTLQQQGAGVKINFTVGLKDAERVSASQSLLTMLSSGVPALLTVFSSTLDTELQARGQPRVNLSAAAVSFSAPTVNQISSASSGAQSGTAVASTWSTDVSQSSSPVSKTTVKDSSTSTLLLGVVIGFVLIGGYLMTRKSQKPAQQSGADVNGVNDAYASKTANLDQAAAADYGFDQ
jgi:hypothetical protein